MKLLWSKDLHLNTVHVRDVAAAIWYLAHDVRAIGEVYNVVDDAHSTQGTLSDMLAEIYDIPVAYWGQFLSSIAKVCVCDNIGGVEERYTRS